MRGFQVEESGAVESLEWFECMQGCVGGSTKKGWQGGSAG